MDQDWTTVVIRGKSAPKPIQPKGKKVTFVGQKDIDIHEKGTDPKITVELKTKLIQARTGSSLKHSELAKKAGQIGKKLLIKDIQNAENGSCTMKEGKQIALIYQKLCNVKIL